MLSDYSKELKTKLMRIGKIDPDLEPLMKQCIRQLAQAVNYEDLFFGKSNQVLADLQTGISQNSRDIISVCLNRPLDSTHKITTSDVNLIRSKVEDNERLVKEFETKIKQIIDT